MNIPTSFHLQIQFASAIGAPPDMDYTTADDLQAYVNRKIQVTYEWGPFEGVLSWVWKQNRIIISILVRHQHQGPDRALRVSVFYLYSHKKANETGSHGCLWICFKDKLSLNYRQSSNARCSPNEKLSQISMIFNRCVLMSNSISSARQTFYNTLGKNYEECINRYTIFGLVRFRSKITSHKNPERVMHSWARNGRTVTVWCSGNVCARKSIKSISKNILVSIMINYDFYKMQFTK